MQSLWDTLINIYNINSSGKKRQQFRFQCNKRQCKRTNKKHIPLRENTLFKTLMFLHVKVYYSDYFVHKFLFDLAIGETVRCSDKEILKEDI